MGTGEAGLQRGWEMSGGRSSYAWAEVSHPECLGQLVIISSDCRLNTRQPGRQGL